MLLIIAFMSACGPAAPTEPPPPEPEASPSPAASPAASPRATPGALGAADIQQVTIQLNPESDSGEAGTATLTAEGDQTRVVLELTGQPAGVPQPAHIHEGTCTNLNPAPLHPLSDVTDGRSETTVPVSLAELTAGNLAINVHQSADAVQTYVACGDLPAVEWTAMESPAASPMTSPEQETAPAGESMSMEQ
jgi:hypothetical protein